MNPFAVLQERKFKIAGIPATQSVNAATGNETLFVTTCFSIEVDEKGSFEHCADTIVLPVSESQSLLDEGWRLRLAEKQMANLAARQRKCADLLDAALAKKDEPK